MIITIIVIMINIHIFLSQQPPVPWTAIMTSAPFWAINIAQFTYNWGGYTLLTSLPKYLNDVLHFNLAAVRKCMDCVGVPIIAVRWLLLKFKWNIKLGMSILTVLDKYMIYCIHMNIDFCIKF